MEYGKECFCWYNDKRYKRLGRLEGSFCDIPCEGDDSRTCGGHTALEVFKIKNLNYDENVNLPK